MQRNVLEYLEETVINSERLSKGAGFDLYE